jgi:hypothetical protein
MMYNNNLAAAIKVGGKILREFGDIVYLPFGSEYQIRLKNLNQARAKLDIEIDGDNVTGSGIVLSSFQTIDLERFIRNGNLSEGNRFKFIECTEKIENHRGIKLEDGLIVIKYNFELGYSYSKTPLWRNLQCSSGGRYTNSVRSVSLNDVGITVEGSKSDQKFSTTSWGISGETHTMIIKLLGETEANKKVREPVTVKTKLECKTCGTLNPINSKFCSECGTALEKL